MAISCEKCRRQYDVTLFEFGRTVNCTCGTRVGFQHNLNLAKSNEIKFFADVNVARVARWLRAIGIDTVWEDAISDKDLIKRSLSENRFVLTLDKRLPEEWRTNNVLLLKSEKPFEQFREIIGHFDIKKPKEFFTRCLVCNNFLRAATAEETLNNAPARVLEMHAKFTCCPICGKVFWEGSHAKRMRQAIRKVFDEK